MKAVTSAADVCTRRWNVVKIFHLQDMTKDKTQFHRDNSLVQWILRLFWRFPQNIKVIAGLKRTLTSVNILIGHQTFTAVNSHLIIIKFSLYLPFFVVPPIQFVWNAETWIVTVCLLKATLSNLPPHMTMTWKTMRTNVILLSPVTPRPSQSITIAANWKRKL